MWYCASRLLVVGATLILLLTACGGASEGDGGPEVFYSIHGTVSGSIWEGVLMTLGGLGVGETVTDASGVYHFYDLPPGTYSVTPSGENLLFNPGNQICILEDGDVTELDFVSVGDGPDLEDVTPPETTQQLIFVHQSSGDKWLMTGEGDLGDTLASNNYYVSDVSSGWDATLNLDIGTYTDIGHAWTWFMDESGQTNGETRRDNICDSLYTSNDQYGVYTNTQPNPGGENSIIVFKSHHRNSHVNGDNGLPPSSLYGQASNSNAHTLPNCKEVYRQLLTYFKDHTSKMFVIVTAPPLATEVTLLTHAANARNLHQWLVDEWLTEADWELENVYVYDLFNVLSDVDNHHRVAGGFFQHIAVNGDNFSYYPTTTTDSDPNTAGTQKATAEFVPFLNACWHRWQKSLIP